MNSSPKPLVDIIYTADPSAHVFNGTLYVYPSHDRDSNIPDNDNGDQYDMVDYHVLAIPTLKPLHVTEATESSSTSLSVTNHGPVLTLEQIPWAKTQLWAPDAASANGKYYLYFPARDHDNIFRIGVAISVSPTGPFVPDDEYIPGTYSIDPAVFIDGDDGKTAWLYTGGLWGGQLQCWQDKVFNQELTGPQEPSGEGVPALMPQVARLSSSMRNLASPLQDLIILAPETSRPILAADHARRFFEASWMHKYRGKYYFSYSTGDTHCLVYAIGESPTGPFTYAGRLLEPVLGWTTHHSIVEFEGRWWLFYHDSSLSGGKSHLRCVKVREILYDEDGLMRLAVPQ